MAAPLVLSIFPGIDLLGRAFEEEGFTVVRGPDVLWGGDIRTFHPPAGKFDGVIGGPPWQPFSPLVHLVRANGREPKHENLIPEFERIVWETACEWFVMEEVVNAPVPQPWGAHPARVTSFVLDHSTLDDGSGFGHAQMRKRRFSFGWRRGEPPPDLRQWIQFAALELPNPAPAVCCDAHDVPVAIGGSGKVKATTVSSHGDAGHRIPERIRTITKERTVRVKNDGNPQPWEKARAVVAREMSGGISPEKLAWQQANRKSGLAPGNFRKRTWAECCALQGLPADFLAEAPFTQAGKFTVLGNAVPLPMGRAIARAVKQAMNVATERTA
jgi:site-specific DNA-cytosine methylase